MDGWGIVAILVGYMAVSVLVFGWAAWRLRRPEPLKVHPAVPALMLVFALALLTVWIIRGDWLGIVSSALLATSFGISLRTALTRRSAG